VTSNVGGWPGVPDADVPDFEDEGLLLHPVTLSAEEVRDYYEGFSNGTLWPLYHDVVAPPVFERDWWHSYVRVNNRFADAVAKTAAQGATVWIQDYQLQLAPAMLREQRPDLRIGFFLHIPFPPAELFSQVPWRRELLEGLLGADLVGFQLSGAAQNFIRLVRQRVGHKTHRDSVYLPDGRVACQFKRPEIRGNDGFEAGGIRYEVKEPFNPTAFLKSPYGIMILVSVAMILCMKNMPNMEEMQAAAQAPK